LAENKIRKIEKNYTNNKKNLITKIKLNSPATAPNLIDAKYENVEEERRH